MELPLRLRSRLHFLHILRHHFRRRIGLLFADALAVLAFARRQHIVRLERPFDCRIECPHEPVPKQISDRRPQPHLRIAELALKRNARAHLVARLVLHQPRQALHHVFPEPRQHAFVFIFDVVEIQILEKRLHVTLKSAVLPRHLRRELECPATYVHVRDRPQRLVQLRQIHPREFRAEVKMRLRGERLRADRQSQPATAEAVAFDQDLRGILLAVLAWPVAQSRRHDPHVRHEHVHLRGLRRVLVTQQAVVQFEMRDLERKQILDHVLPSPIDIRLTLRLGFAHHEGQLAFVHVNIADDLPAKQIPPRDGERDLARPHERRPHLLADLVNLDALQRVAPAPQRDADIRHLSRVTGNTLQPVVDLLLHHERQRNPRRQQHRHDHDDRDDDASWPAAHTVNQGCFLSRHAKISRAWTGPPRPGCTGSRRSKIRGPGDMRAPLTNVAALQPRPPPGAGPMAAGGTPCYLCGSQVWSQRFPNVSPAY